MLAAEDEHTANTHNLVKKVLVIGLGQLGLPVAKYVKEKGFDVYGYDISQKAIQRAEKIAAIKKADNFGEFDVYIICISTHKPDDMFTPHIDGLLSIVQEKIAKEARNGALVSIESTIPRGTSKKVFEMLNHRLHVAHIPHRWYALEEKEHGVNQLRVIGGVCDCCLKAAAQFYGQIVNVNNNNNNSNNNYNNIEIGNGNGIDRSNDNNSIFMEDTGIEVIPSTRDDAIAAATTTFPTTANTSTTSSTADKNNNNNNTSYTPNLGIPLHPVSDVEIAEITKIAENAHRYLQIAFAEDLYLYCQANSINFPELREALNTKWNVEILEPRDGIGGHCLPKDTKMFLQSSKSVAARSRILQASIEVDEEYKRYRLSRASQAANIQTSRRTGGSSSIRYD
ncbi:MAG TPA: NAD(P)-binding domain-containing protein [Nitrososphaeraceae archaeon]|nr:NAD(P)-binding domain-containing protein [Nitrososphaeraceae archaeon]